MLRKDDKLLDQVFSYRPLCPLDSCGKLLEKLLDNRIREHLNTSSARADSQYGFRRGQSTIHAIQKLVSIVNNCRKDVLTLNIRNAFNSASWEIILRETSAKNIHAYIFRVLSSYFQERKLLYSTDGPQQEDNISSGVPQGSVLGPTL